LNVTALDAGDARAAKIDIETGGVEMTDYFAIAAAVPGWRESEEAAAVYHRADR
jgi:hypothetical protein